MGQGVSTRTKTIKSFAMPAAAVLAACLMAIFLMPATPTTAAPTPVAATKASSDDVMRGFSARAGSPTVFGHRGGFKSFGTRENSITAFKKSIAYGYPIETDLQYTRDGRAAIYHDATISRSCAGPGRGKWIGGLTASQVRNTRCGGHMIPVLTDLIKLVANNPRARVLLETKQVGRYCSSAANRLLVEYASEIANAPYMSGRVMLMSFCDDHVWWFGGLAPDVPAAYLAREARGNMVDYAYYMGAEVIGVGYQKVYTNFVRYAHQRGLQVNVWNIVWTGEGDRARRMGVDTITTDWPTRMRR